VLGVRIEIPVKWSGATPSLLGPDIRRYGGHAEQEAVVADLAFQFMLATYILHGLPPWNVCKPSRAVGRRTDARQGAKTEILVEIDCWGCSPVLNPVALLFQVAGGLR
jgi:hypothetical protein